MTGAESQLPPAGSTIAVAGATGYIGQCVVRELLARGYRVLAVARDTPQRQNADIQKLWPDAKLCLSDVGDARQLAADVFTAEPVAAVVSCISSRSGAPADAWRIDYQANRNLLDCALQAGCRQFVLLSAICVQRPRLAFQHAKLAFEQELTASTIGWSIVRPTAFFKSLAGQIERLKAGKPFLMFGSGELTACTPIAETELAEFIGDCLQMPERNRQILPIGGPGPAITPRAQGEMLFELLDLEPRFRRVSPRIFDLIVPLLATPGRLLPTLADKAEFARTGHYYGTESMLVWNAETGGYDRESTPVYGQQTLRDFYQRVLREGLAGQELGDHAVF